MAFIHQRPAGRANGLMRLPHRQWMTPQQFDANFAPLASDTAKAVASLRSLGFNVTKVSPQLIEATGNAATVNAAFGTRVVLFKDQIGTHVGTLTKLTLPSSLAALKATVVGLGGAPVAVHPEFRLAKTLPNQQPGSQRPGQLNRSSPYGGYWFTDLKQAYQATDYRVLNGQGIKIATIGYADFSSSDAFAYWAHEGLFTGSGGLANPPTVVHDIYAGSLAFGATGDYDVEANLDVQQSGGAAPGATIIGVAADYQSNYGFLEAYTDLANANSVDVISTSYGGCELYYTAAYNGGLDFTGLLAAYDDIFAQLGSQGTSVMFSSGDDSGLTCPNVAGNTLIPSVDFWADDPNVTAVGGTNLQTTYPSTALESQRVAEAAVADYFGTGEGYFGSGGGYSTIWAESPDQVNAGYNFPGRGVPDVSMHMGGCPQGAALCAADYGSIGQPGFFDSYDIAYYEGSQIGLIGTSASSPEFAGTVATWDSASGVGRIGLANPILYYLASTPSSIYNGGIPYYNGVVGGLSTAGLWNPVVGLGSINPDQLEGGTHIAGNPQTASNP